MKIEQSKHIAKKYVKDELSVLELTRDIITAHNEGYKMAHDDINDVLMGSVYKKTQRGSK